MLKNLWCLILLIFSSSVFADVEYYTYGSFENVRDAFILIANIMSDPWYLGIGAAMGSLGIFVATLINVGKNMMGKGEGSFLPALIMCFFGASLFMVFLTPKTTVHIYDTTTSRYESVGNVPTSLAEIAYLSNLFERYGSNVTASASLYGRDKHANGNSLELLLNILSVDPLKHNVQLGQSLERYLTTCVSPAVSHPDRYDSFDYAAMLSGTTNFWGELEKTRNSNQYFHWQGGDMDCDQGFDEVYKVLVTDFDTTFKPVLDQVCGEAGYDDTDPASILECGTMISEVGSIVFSSTLAYAPNQLMAMSAISQSLYHVLTENVGTAVRDFGNMQAMSQGIGALLVSEGWLPSIRLATLVIILASSSVIVWFFFTPFLVRSLHLLLSLFAFMALWGVFDSVLHVVKMISIQNSFSDIHAYQGGIKSFLMAPGELQKVIASYGKMQGLGVSLAALLTAILFKITATPFAHMAERMADDVESIGKNTGNEILDVSNRQKKMRDMAETSAHYEAMSLYGVERYALGAHSSTYPYRQQEAEISAIREQTGRSTQDALMDQATIPANVKAGDMLAHDEMAAHYKTSAGDNAATGAKLATMRSHTQDRAYGSASQIIAKPTQASQMEELAVKETASLRQTAATPTDSVNKVAAVKNAEDVGSAEEKFRQFPSKDEILDHTSEVTRLQIEDSKAQIKGRADAVDSGLADSTQDVANISAESQVGHVLGSAKESAKHGNSVLEGSYYTSGQSTEAGNRANIGGNKAANKMADNVNRSPVELEEMKQSQHWENEVVSALRRIMMSETLEQSELQTAFQELAKQPLFLAPEQYGALVDKFYQGEMEAPLMADPSGGWVTFSWDPDNGMQNIAIETGNYAVNHSSVNRFEDGASRIENANAAVMLATLDSINSEAAMLDLAREGVKGFGVYRNMQEGESTHINAGVGGDVRLSGSMGVDGGKVLKAAGNMKELIPGRSKAGNSIPEYIRGPMNEPVRVPSRGGSPTSNILSDTGDAVSGLGNLKLGGGVGSDVSAKMSDSSSETASIDPAVGSLALAIANAKRQLSEDPNMSHEDRLNVASEFQREYESMQSMSIEQLLTLSKGYEIELLKDHAEYPGLYSKLKEFIKGDESDNEIKELLEKKSEDGMNGSHSDVFLR